MTLELGEVALRAVLEGSLMMIQEMARKRGIRLEKKLEGIPEFIQADERKVKQILYNLLSNAVKFSSEGGVVCLKARVVDAVVRPGLRKEDSGEIRIIRKLTREGEGATGDWRGCLELAVADNGIGIRPEDLRRVFDRFEQPGGSSAQRSQGTGIGLALTRELVRLHGGMIWAESEGEGKGSTFRVVIPA
jgi:signal transduction histidine kinase